MTGSSTVLYQVRGREMVTCPKCNASIDVEEEDLDEGDVLSCDECGASLKVASVNPVELETEDDGKAHDDEDYDEDDDDEDDEEDEDEDEEWH
jgi:alpha-aminoadipate carrier protein LysW